MKRLKTITIIIGFIMGILLSVFIGDAMDFAARKIASFRVAMHIKKAEQLAGSRRYPEAVALYDGVLVDISETVQPRLFARVKTSKGLTLAAQSAQTKNKDDITRAIRAFEESLRVYRVDQYPEDYAAAQNNIGILYLQLAEVYNRGDNLHSAISAFDESLRVFTGAKNAENRAMVEANRRKAVEEQQKTTPTLIMPVLPPPPPVPVKNSPPKKHKRVRHAHL